MSNGDEIFEGILASATAMELESTVPPQRWLDSWTVENGCAQFPGHAQAYWNDERMIEMQRRERELRPIAGGVAPEYVADDPLGNMPWKTVVEAAEALGVTRGAIYKWQKNPETMPLTARRLLAFFIMAPIFLRDAVIKTTTN